MSYLSLDDVPTAAEIREGVIALRPFMREGYVRSRAHSMYSNNWTAVISDEQVQALKDSGNFISIGGLWESRTNPGSAVREVNGYFRWSDALGIHMPAPIPADTDAMCRDETRASWVASTAGDDATIDAYANENADSDLNAIQEAFEAVLSQIKIAVTKGMLDRLTQIAAGLDEVVESHSGREGAFEELAELWGSWRSAEAYVSYEIFGGQVESSAATHRQMFADLIRCVAEEGVVQVAALAALNNALADEQRGAEEALQREAYPWGVGSVARFVGNVLVVGRIPLLGDILGIADFVVEIASEGERQGYTSGWIDWVLGQMFPEYPGVVTEPIVHQLRDDLVAAAEAAETALYGDRTARLSNYLDDAAYDYASKRRRTPWELIPGRPE